ncbi:zinc transporter foi [Wyeomyia smithii]|uniref:zinc transporter foi n=1 Tax=Wyeomyia smithii TaxID=174621 RepID=UPI002467F22E|nr:zinc transporter foi [Wyeomyia smithii]XP_055532043.1 zinc transporter foi [Wyeomyia smithii]XP_055532044.1 zinc transporter foi [Wyeomyia smithii]XP_055532045.1 zinc transporter foi [Wyeomyia smithii]XP_055532046.1 zinc transporter foi [Wyeomyia smithii]XP_055532047.1 zinc transporter foi [Wyeomyia smithii]XP_055532048.1 zinc transporter foi [Wyeomyia smithii]XP_055532050.1 zinc transporter foi [Wyeomyia smithii]XP_055532051.1 zinc transporter foi [Wyeomyia smithii]
MVRNIMAVCVVCLLCADHLPCKRHDDDPMLGRISTASNANSVYRRELDFRRLNASWNHPGSEKARLVKRHNHHSGDHHHHHGEEDDDEEEDLAYRQAANEKMDSFIRKIFGEFGDALSMTMDVTGFENMMKRLNMYRLVTDGETTRSSVAVQPIASSDHPDGDDGSCISSIDFVQQIAAPKPQTVASTVAVTNQSKANDSSTSGSSSSNISSTTISSSSYNSSDKISNKTNPNISTNSSSSSLLSELDRLKSSIRLDRQDLLNICPILLAQLSSKTSRERAGCIDPSSVPQLSSLAEGSSVSSVHHAGEHTHCCDSIELTVWVYSTIAVLGVSLCGLLGVAVIPCMDRHFYQHALQFLVALAVGTLCGDALLHLLPHAMMETTMANSHDEMMYKGLAAVAGIVFFYFMERFLTVVAEWYKHQEKKDKPSSRVRVMRDPDAGSLHGGSGGEKQCKHKYSSYPYCYDEIAMETKDDHHEHNHVSNHERLNNHNSATAKCANHGEHGDHTTEYLNLQQGNGKEDPGSLDNNTISTNLDDASIEREQANSHQKPKMRPENYTIILREHETKHHGHSHAHGHVHSPPGSLSAVAWMVIMGDGLHNFTDGMTIGAAFANNIAGGFSTAIAVFCHELPHELGDFAVLLKAGMSARDAVYYNLLSSILSFIGMVVGIVIGHQPEASAWVFSVAAGLFLYIALVDMIPELTSAHGAEDRCKTSEFLLQFFGMSAGFGIMLLIATYEHDLKELFVD